MIESVQELTGDIATNQTLTGELDYRATGGKVDDVQVNGTSVVENKIANIDLTGKQDTLVSGTNIKAINNNSLLGSGNVNINEYLVSKWQWPGNNKVINNDELINYFGIVFTYYNQNQKTYPFSFNNCVLSDIWQINSIEALDYDRYQLTFYGIALNSGTKCIEEYTMIIYTHYQSGQVYDYNDANYYPRTTGHTWYQIASKADLDDFLRKNNTNAFTPTGDYNPATKKYVDDNVNSKQDILVSGTNIKTINNSTLLGSGNVSTETNVVTNSDSAYTISNLLGHYLYNLGEKTSITITAVDNIYDETNIFFDSGATATTFSMPDSILNLGDAPNFTNADNVNTAVLLPNYKYIVTFLNGYANWKKYHISILPSAYQEVQFIQSTGTQYLDTGISCSGGIKCIYNATYQSGGYLCGAHGVEIYGRCGANTPGNTWELGYGDNIPTAGDFALNVNYDVEYQTYYDSAYLKVKGGAYSDWTTLIQDSGQTTTSLNALIFAQQYAITYGEPLTQAQLYSLKIYNNNNVLVGDFVPCYRKSDNEIGLYNLVNDDFIYNIGEGTLIKGNNV